MAIGHTLYGDGPEAVVVMHGWFSDHTVYETIKPWLDTARFTFAFMDARGYGLSKDIDGAHSLTEMGGDAFALAESLGWDRFHAVGHSMSGKTVQWMAREAPKRLKTAIGITPVPAIAIPFDAAGMELFSTAWDRPEKRTAIIDMTTGSRLGALWAQRLSDRSLAQSTAEAFRDYFHAWQAEDHSEGMAGVKTPWLACVGRHDGAVPPGIMEATTMTWFETAEIALFEDSGHYPMLESPPHLAKAIQDFMLRYA